MLEHVDERRLRRLMHKFGGPSRHRKARLLQELRQVRLHRRARILAAQSTVLQHRHRQRRHSTRRQRYAAHPNRPPLPWRQTHPRPHVTPTQRHARAAQRQRRPAATNTPSRRWRHRSLRRARRHRTLVGVNRRQRHAPLRHDSAENSHAPAADAYPHTGHVNRKEHASSLQGIYYGA